jgi:PRTRC genetic system protein A
MNGQDLIMKFDELLDITRASYAAFAEQTERAIAEQRPMVLAVDEQNIDAEKFQLDVALLKAAPIAAVPAHSAFHPLQDAGHRFLLAADGLYLEVRRPWLHFIHRLAEHTSVRIPYGLLANKVELAFGQLGTALEQMREFAVHAMEAAPLESAASLIWNSNLKQWSIKLPKVIGEATASSIRYEQVELAEDGSESVAIDLHSHGHGPAFFSETDDGDDAGTVKIAGVFGNLDQNMPTVAFRLCVLGLYLPIQVPAEKIFG